MKIKKMHSKDSPFEKTESGEQLFHCRVCGYLGIDSFFESSIKRKIHRCKTCQMDDTQRIRKRNSKNPYYKMLCYLKKQRKAGKKGAHCFLEEADIRYLYHDIWKEKCALTGNKKDLGFVCWKKNVGLKPWNLVLMEKKHVRAHRQETIYQISYPEQTTKKVEESLDCIRQHYSGSVNFYEAK